MQISKTHRLLDKILLPLFVYCGLRFLRLSEHHSFFSSWTQILRKIKRHKWSFVRYMVFSKLSLAKYHFLHKKPVFIVTSIYFISCLQLSTEMQLQFKLFHVFIYYSTSLQIFLFYKFFSTNVSTIFRSSHRRCSIKKAILKHFVIFIGKHL